MNNYNTYKQLNLNHSKINRNIFNYITYNSYNNNNNNNSNNINFNTNINKNIKNKNINNKNNLFPPIFNNNNNNNNNNYKRLTLIHTAQCPWVNSLRIYSTNSIQKKHIILRTKKRLPQNRKKVCKILLVLEKALYKFIQLIDWLTNINTIYFILI